MMVSYTATSMALAISAGQSVVTVANLFVTIAFVFMTVSSIIQFSRLNPEILEMLKSRNPTSTEFSWILQKDWGVEHVEYPDLSNLNILRLWGRALCFVLLTNKNQGAGRLGVRGRESGSSALFSVALAASIMSGKPQSGLELDFIHFPSAVSKTNLAAWGHDSLPLSKSTTTVALSCRANNWAC